MSISSMYKVRQILHPALGLGVAMNLGAGLEARPLTNMPLTNMKTTGQQHRITIRYRTCVTEIYIIDYPL